MIEEIDIRLQERCVANSKTHNEGRVRMVAPNVSQLFVRPLTSGGPIFVLWMRNLAGSPEMGM